MKIPHALSVCLCLLAGAGFLAVSPARADPLTLTTREADGGFDGWCSTFWGRGVDDFGPDSKGKTLNAGNLRPTGYDRSATILMFALSSVRNLNPADIVSVRLTYYVAEAYGTPNLTVTHGTKTARKLIRGADNVQQVTTPVWTAVGTVSAIARQTGALDVTNSFLDDLRSGNVYSSYRIVQAQTYGSRRATFPYGSRIASSENTSGQSVPTLIITTRTPHKP